MRTPLLILAGLLVAAGTAAAQHDHHQAAAGERGQAMVPAGWQYRMDRPDQNPGDIHMMVMEPGWHVTLGPTAIFWEPGRTARGQYRVESEIHLFDPGRRTREAYGFFVGGRNLDGEDQAYTYFLIRGTGDFIVKQRVGDQAPTIIDWTNHEAVRPWREGETSVANTLAVDVGERDVRFIVNGTQVAELPRGNLSMDGIVGLRVNQ